MDGALDVEEFERCIRGGGVAVFPTDTLYGIGCRVGDDAAVERVYALKGRSREKPSALMYFSLAAALEAHPDLGPRTRAALERLLPGPVLAVLPGGQGVRVPALDGPPAGAGVTVLQTSANLSGGPDPRRLEDVPESIRAGADLVLDGGELPGVPSTVVDLSRYESGQWAVLREGAVSHAQLDQMLDGSTR
ncbi:MAG: L-threonylcarbamoyladenylate synthase [Solirubrobacterales bacterium]